MRRTTFCGLTLCLVVLAGSQITHAQAPTINSTVYRDKVRFESQGRTKELRVEVFNASGQKLFDSGFVAGQTLDWNMLDQQGEPVADGVYDYLVTTRKHSGKKSDIELAQLSILREGRNLESAPALVHPAAPGSGGGSGNVTGNGTAGQLTKWTGATTLGDSVLTEKDGKIGLATTNPVSLLHILGSQPVTSTLTGTNATEGLRVIGGKGGDTSGSGQTAGNGASLVLQAGDGGDALTGTSGRGGYVTIQPGAAGIGSLGGGFGQVILAPGGGNVGIGVTNAGSKLTVEGMIETTLGGLKFPDGTTQTTAATTGLTSILHNGTLFGNGTSGSPLGVADGGIGTTQLANNAVTLSKIANGQVVTSLNSLKDQVTLQAGSNITITPSGNTLTIAAPNSLTSIDHDATLTGNGTAGSSLGVATPLILTGAVPQNGSFAGAIKATNTGESGTGVVAFGGNSSSGFGGEGVFALGGNSDSSLGGAGVDARGGPSNASGGVGVQAIGGDGTSHGGFGLIAQGGNSDTFGGVGVDAVGGSHRNTDGNGGRGVQAVGGEGSGAGHQSGDGMVAFGGIGINGATNGLAGVFVGDVSVSGNLSKGGGSFKIDHPLDPENKYLYHSFVESPDMKNIYDGNIVTDENGEATITLPDYFEALNRDFRYQLTTIGTFAQAIVADEIKGNRFSIRTSLPNVKVSWQVTGIRQDSYANAHRIKVEEEKPERERGYYLHPEVFNQPEERGVEWARNPEMTQRLKQRRIEAELKLKQQQQ